MANGLSLGLNFSNYEDAHHNRDYNAGTIPAISDLRSKTEIVVMVVFLIIVTILTMAGNGAVIAVVFLYEELREQVSNIFIVSLAFTDFFTSFLVMIPAGCSIIADEWPFGKFACDFHCHANYSLLMLSYLTLMFISMDRTEAVVHSLHYASRVTKTRVKSVIVILWIYCWCWCSIPALSNWVRYDYSEANCGIDWSVTESRWWVGITVICYYLPSFSVIIVGSVIIIMSAEKSNKNLQIPTKISTVVPTTQIESVATKEKDAASSNKKLIKSLMVLVFTFNVCVTPFVVVRVAKLSVGLGSETSKSQIMKWISTFSSFGVFTSSATNPFIYAIFRKDFRTAFRKLFRSISRKVYPR